jgi:hypothetical protein
VYGTPVLPIFAAEMTEDAQFKKFEYGKASALLDNSAHNRKDNAQRVIDELRHVAFMGMYSILTNFFPIVHLSLRSTRKSF